MSFQEGEQPIIKKLTDSDISSTKTQEIVKKPKLVLLSEDDKFVNDLMIVNRYLFLSREEQEKNFEGFDLSLRNLLSNNEGQNNIALILEKPLVHEIGFKEIKTLLKAIADSSEMIYNDLKITLPNDFVRRLGNAIINQENKQKEKFNMRALEDLLLRVADCAKEKDILRKEIYQLFQVKKVS